MFVKTKASTTVIEPTKVTIWLNVKNRWSLRKEVTKGWKKLKSLYQICQTVASTNQELIEVQNKAWTAPIFNTFRIWIKELKLLLNKLENQEQKHQKPLLQLR